MDTRLDKMEERIAYQDKLLSELDEVVREFGTRISTLERRLKEVQAGAEADPIGPHDDPPPHY